MRRIRPVSLPSAFLAGVLCASALAAIPALADIVPSDQNPNLYDGASPLLTVQPAKFIIGSSLDLARDCGPTSTFNRVPMQLTWNAQDTGSGASSFDIGINYAEVGDVEAASRTTATTHTWDVTNYDNGGCGGGDDSPNYLWVIARDYRGYTATSPQVSDRFNVWDEGGIDRSSAYDSAEDLIVARTGAWSTSNCDCHNQGRTTFASARGVSLTYTVNVGTPGRTLAVVAPTGSTRGVMNICVDGGAATPVNTYISSPVSVNRVIVWQRTLDAGQHTVRIVNAATAGHPRINIDTLMLGPAWKGEVGRYYQEDLCG